MKTQEEILQIVINYEKELHDVMRKNIDAYGHLDTDTKRDIERWLSVLGLLNRLDILDI